MDKITAVLGLYRHLDLTVEFLNEFHSRFPDVPVAISVAGNTSEYQDTILNTYKDQDWIRIASGRRDTRISFSETWNYAINEVRTERFVFLHNDMYIHDDFFRNLNAKMDQYGPDHFYLYTTVEPLENQGFIRPGKIVAPFGHSREDFNLEEFNAFVQSIISSERPDGMGYGFYLAGFTSSLQDVGGFDSRSFFPVFCEDDDINFRIRLKGYKILVVHKAVVYHFGSKTIRLEAEKSMSDGEVQCNRMFARKWGFEARFLWSTGYENLPKVSDGAETIGFTPKIPISDLDLMNAEPLVDFVDARNNPNLAGYFRDTNTEGKVFQDPKDLESVDILIQQDGPTNFNELAYLVGNLRFWHDRLKVGQARVGSYVVDIRNLREETRVDSTNYLSLLPNYNKDVTEN